MASDIGSYLNLDFLSCNPERLDVTSFMIFTKSLEYIRSKINVCLDGEWIQILVVAEETVKLEASESILQVSSSSNDLDDYSSSDQQAKEVKVTEVNPRGSSSDNFERNVGDFSQNIRKKGDRSIEKKKQVDKVNYCFDMENEQLDSAPEKPSAADSISSNSCSFVACSLGTPNKNLNLHDEVAKKVVPAGILINNPNVSGPICLNGLGVKTLEAQLPLNTTDNPCSIKGLTSFNPNENKLEDQQSHKVEHNKEQSEGELNKNYINFDAHCSRIRNSKKVRKKMRVVFDLGAKADKFIYPVEYRNIQNADFTIPLSGSSSSILYKKNSGNMSLSYNSLTHSDIRNCNSRISLGGLGNMAIAMWNSMNRIGITSVSDAFEPIARIQEFEKREVKGGEGAKGLANFFQC